MFLGVRQVGVCETGECCVFLGFNNGEEAASLTSPSWACTALEQLGPHLSPGTRCFSIWNPGSSESLHVAAPSFWMSARCADATTGLGWFLKNSFCELIKLG